MKGISNLKSSICTKYSCTRPQRHHPRTSLDTMRSFLVFFVCTLRDWSFQKQNRKEEAPGAKKEISQSCGASSVLLVFDQRSSYINQPYLNRTLSTIYPFYFTFHLFEIRINQTLTTIYLFTYFIFHLPYFLD